MITLYDISWRDCGGDLDVDDLHDAPAAHHEGWILEGPALVIRSPLTMRDLPSDPIGVIEIVAPAGLIGE